MFFDSLIALAKLLFRAYDEHGKKIASVFAILGVSVAVAGVGLAGRELQWFSPELAKVIATAAGFIAAVTVTALSGYQLATEEKKKEESLSEKQALVRAQPEKARLVWDLAQEKLEHYLDRNLRQIRAIFMLCTFVMFIGFGLVVFGSVMVFRNPTALQPSVLSAVSGILISFLGGSFLFLYRSTMSQAKDYVAMLERINAVGMSLQVIDSISEQSSGKRDEMRALIAKELLALYKHA